MKANIHVLAPLLLLILAQSDGSRKTSSILSQRETLGAVPLSMAEESGEDMYCDKTNDQIRFNFTQLKTNKDIPLSMAEDLVDDMYFGCQGAMMTKTSYYYEKEMKNALFAKSWKDAWECAQKEPMKVDSALTRDHMQAICAYTQDAGFYDEFSNAVRTSRSEYGTSFGFHSMHFLLTSAIQILNYNSGCHITYRRTETTFAGEVGQIFRFGSFASSSYRTDLTAFGKENCFKIKTCSGAYLKYYSYFGNSEKEVLIPPYEKFKITDKIIGQGKFHDLKDCEVVYVVESAGIESNLNCKAV